MPETARIKQQNCEAITKAISNLEVVNYDTVSSLIPKLLEDGELTLDHSVYTPADSTTISACGIGRYLVYEHADKTNPFSIWALAFAPRQKTSIHDHKYKGTVTVLEGPVSEIYYQPTEEHSARRVARFDRHRFHSNSDNLDDTFVHQLKRRKGLGEGTSVTLHIYNMEAHLISPEGELIDRRNLNTIFSKDKRLDEQKNLPYVGEYQQLGFPK